MVNTGSYWLIMVNRGYNSYNGNIDGIITGRLLGILMGILV